MPIKIPNRLPAIDTLTRENIFVMAETRAESQDIRPLKIGILNLMPLKVETETQLLRLLSNTPLQLEIDLVTTETYTSKHISADHLLTFYKKFSEIKNDSYDGFIITGAPVELLEYEEVEYFDELKTIMSWCDTHVFSTFHICWGAQAGLYFHYGIQKYPLKKKLSGVFEHKRLSRSHPLTRGFDDRFLMPHSRYTEIRRSDIDANEDIILLSDSDEAGVCLAVSDDCRRVFITGHCEYDAITLLTEYKRDVEKGLNPNIPKNYLKNDDINSVPIKTWRSHANLLFSNWLNFVYQTTPYDLEELKGGTDIG